MRMPYISLLIVALAAPAHAQSFFTDCRTLNELCEDGAQYASSNQACRGYINGALDQLLADHHGDFCLEKGATPSRIQEIVLQWLAEHRNQGHLSGSSCVLLAVTKSYPCVKN